jgi:hypothetical protein
MRGIIYPQEGCFHHHPAGAGNSQVKISLSQRIGLRVIKQCSMSVVLKNLFMGKGPRGQVDQQLIQLFDIKQAGMMLKHPLDLMLPHPESQGMKISHISNQNP